MKATSYPDIIYLFNRLNIKLSKLTIGSFPTSGKDDNNMPFNFMFIVLDNPNGADNFLEDEKQRLIFKTNHSYFCPAFHTFRCKLDSELVFVSIRFKLELFHGIDLFSRSTQLLELYEPDFPRKMHDFFEYGDKIFKAIKAKELVAHFAASAFEKIDKKEVQMVTKFAAYQDVIDYINRHCYFGVTVGELAKIMHMGRESFSRKFQKDTGVSPKSFFNKILINKATDMLQEPNALVKTVAYQLNFSNEFCFSRFFKHHTGISPKQFLNEYSCKFAL